MIIPSSVDEQGCPLHDTESLSVYSTADVSDHDLGNAGLRALTIQRRLSYTMDFRSERFRRWHAANRRRMCAAFGVKAVKDWLVPDTSFVAVSATDSEVTVSPMRRYGKRDSWAGHRSDPTETVARSDTEAVGAALRRMLALRMPPAR